MTLSDVAIYTLRDSQALATDHSHGRRDLAASIFLAGVGVPIAAYAAIAQLSRIALVAALMALAADACVLVYWAVVIVDALQRIR